MSKTMYMSNKCMHIYNEVFIFASQFMLLFKVSVNEALNDKVNISWKIV